MRKLNSLLLSNELMGAPFCVKLPSFKPAQSSALVCGVVDPHVGTWYL